MSAAKKAKRKARRKKAAAKLNRVLEKNKNELVDIGLNVGKMVVRAAKDRRKK